MFLARRPFPRLKRSPFRFATAAGALLALAVVATLSTLPPKPRLLPEPRWTSGLTSIPGAYHIHTVNSDGSGSIPEVAAAAAHDGLRFVIITDHGDGTKIVPPAYVAGVLCIDAVEISTTGGHYVALGLAPAPYPLGGEPRDVVADVARLGGFGVVAHPYSLEPALRWDAWDLPFDGIEWMNADSERRERGALEIAAAVAHYPFRPAASISSLFRRPVRNLERWDALTQDRRVVGIAGSDAHARIGWNRTDRQRGTTLAALPSYQASFGAFSIHVILARPLTGNAATDARSILDAIEAGHLYTSIDGLAHPSVFTFTAESGLHHAAEGDDLVLDGPVTLRARVNGPEAALVLVRNGLAVAEALGGDATFRERAEPAIYRVEARWPTSARVTPLPWIVGNPIYVLARPRHPQPAPVRAPIVASEALLGAPPAAWRAECAPGFEPPPDRCHAWSRGR